MKLNSSNMEFELICVIINFGSASKVLKYAKQQGISGGTILLGKGTVRNRILEFLELAEVRKEIVLMVAEKNTAYFVLDALNEKLRFDKPHHGIAFSTSVTNILGTNNRFKKENQESRGGIKQMHNLILVIVDRGKGALVVEAANKAGSRGATIINGRGSGIHETSKLFAMEVEPEKEIVLIISQNESTEEIASSIRKELKIDDPGNGIIFIQEINKAYGLY
ncbi:P-II family nitrogen regulator [Alkaliphilus transvaalensis]|uniref:P-II family nitrogen regulator n=1 Tax=Alkaliphilus transvaalensis TaxID=114628 RepID=UPI00047DC301|nr:P-II family nitrogen regulator [Alkaliphilus transvaalensis]